MQEKPGYMTTEFIALVTTIVAAIVTGLVIAGLIDEAQKEVVIAGLVVLVLAVVAAVRKYTESRTRVKEAASQAQTIATLEKVNQTTSHAYGLDDGR